MIFQDDRTAEEKETHTVIVLATDTFMSGWGKAKGMVSFAGWACREVDLSKVWLWVSSKPEMKRVRLVSGDYRPHSAAVHCHIYVVKEGHSALS